MLKQLSYSVTFPTTGRCFANQIDFAPGLTAITGANEAGKTLNVEMITYAYFGKAALRGAASDYRDLMVDLTSTILGDDWHIYRDRRREEFTINGETVAVGAEAINREVPARLGFGLDVFNIACAAQQGDIDALTKMRPTERRQMVDRLVGADLLETVEKDCRTEAKARDTVTTYLLTSMAEPQLPTEPDGYVPSAKLEEIVQSLRENQSQREALLRVSEPERPVKPKAGPKLSVVDLQQHEELRQEQLRNHARLEGQLSSIPELLVSAEDLERARAYKDNQAELARRGPEPQYQPEELALYEKILDAQAALTEAVTCPNCTHEFHPGMGAEQEELAKLSSPLTRREIAEQNRRHAVWAEAGPLLLVEPFEVANYDQQLRAFEQQDLRREIEDSLACPLSEDRSVELAEARRYEQELAVYQDRLTRYDQDLAAFTEAQEKLNDLPDRGGLLSESVDLLAESRHYEGLLARYHMDKEAFDKVRADATKSAEEAEAFRAGATALRDTRVAVKQALAPSLSTAASSLLAAMTNGERRSIDVDEDFNITADGQPVQTLSGSAKSVVNLALRLGLGQVLTARVLPIFLGDELDAAMDNTRAGSTHTTMQNLRSFLSQIIIVTHKEIEADNIVQLG